MRHTASAPHPPQLAVHLLHLRSRALPSTLVSLTGAALAVGWGLEWLMGQPEDDAATRAALSVLGPVLMSAAIGVSLHSHSPDADGTASRRWWPVRGGHLLALAAIASVLLAVAVLGDPAQFGAAVMVRNMLGAVGVTALAVTVIGARLSWLPMFSYGAVALLIGPREPGNAGALWLWLTQPGTQLPAWCTAVAAFALGTTVYAMCGPRRSGDRR
jgi:hypothetical protein